ncbi:MAG TPA: hypothetical protein VFV25_13425, partial [Methylibium sp.]
MKQQPGFPLARLLALTAAAALSACGGGYSSSFNYSADLADPAIASQLSSIEAVGVGGAGLLSGDPAFKFKALRANLKGGSAQVRFNCPTCNFTITAGGASVGANQFLTVNFPTLDSSSDVAITVKDKVSGVSTVYTLRAAPRDHPP